MVPGVSGHLSLGLVTGLVQVHPEVLTQSQARVVDHQFNQLGHLLCEIDRGDEVDENPEPILLVKQLQNGPK